MKKLTPLTDQQINRLMAYNRDYYGTISKDELPTPRQFGNKFAVINMQDHDEGDGTHWVMLYNCSPSEVIYFDSEGQVPPKSIEKFMDRTKKRKVKNPYRIQELNTDTCGYYCIFVADLLQEGVPYGHVLSYFTNDPRTNEQRITQAWAQRRQWLR